MDTRSLLLAIFLAWSLPSHTSAATPLPIVTSHFSKQDLYVLCQAVSPGVGSGSSAGTLRVRSAVECGWHCSQSAPCRGVTVCPDKDDEEEGAVCQMVESLANHLCSQGGHSEEDCYFMTKDNGSLTLSPPAIQTAWTTLRYTSTTLRPVTTSPRNTQPSSPTVQPDTTDGHTSTTQLPGSTEDGYTSTSEHTSTTTQPVMTENEYTSTSTTTQPVTTSDGHTTTPTTTQPVTTEVEYTTTSTTIQPVTTDDEYTTTSTTIQPVTTDDEYTTTSTTIQPVTTEDEYTTTPTTTQPVTTEDEYTTTPTTTQPVTTEDEYTTTPTTTQPVTTEVEYTTTPTTTQPVTTEVEYTTTPTTIQPVTTEVEYTTTEEPLETTEIACENGGTPDGDRCWCPLPYAGTTCHRYMRDCHEGWEQGHQDGQEDGQYLIQPISTQNPFLVICTFGYGFGVTETLARVKDNNWSNKYWDEYKNGFGTDIVSQHIPNNDYFFIGLEKLHQLLDQANYSGDVFSIYDWGNSMYSSVYLNFNIGDESTHYELSYDKFSEGGNGFHYSPGESTTFSSYDKQPTQCASKEGKGAGWYGPAPNCYSYSVFGDPPFWPLPDNNAQQMEKIKLNVVRWSDFYEN